jgi:hypothetical protein
MDRWKLAKPKNSISISKDGLNANSRDNYTNRFESVSAEKGFSFSVDSFSPVLHYFEVTDMSSSNNDE